MKPGFWLTIYMYKHHIKNQPKSNIWNTVKLEEQILHYFYAGRHVNILEVCGSTHTRQNQNQPKSNIWNTVKLEEYYTISMLDRM